MDPYSSSSFVSSVLTAHRGPGPPRSRGFYNTHNDTPQSVELLWMGDRPVAETSDNTTLTTDNHTLSGIRTRNLSKLSAAVTGIRYHIHGSKLKMETSGHSETQGSVFTLHGVTDSHFPGRYSSRVPTKCDTHHTCHRCGNLVCKFSLDLPPSISLPSFPHLRSFSLSRRIDISRFLSPYGCISPTVTTMFYSVT